MRDHYDIVVIGSGPGGEGAAMTAAKAGRRVAVIDQDAEVGGSCTHRGTIPSKALRHAIQQIASNDDGADPDYDTLVRKADGVVRTQVQLRSGFYERNRVDVIAGCAAFADAQCVEVAVANGARHRCRADKIIIATGSRPYRPPDVDFSHPHIVDSDTVLQLKVTPRSITIYGAGVIGCEYASIFRGLRIKVNLVNTRDKLLAFLDDEIVDALAYHLREQGVLIRHSEDYERVEADENGVRVHLKSNKVIQSDVLLWAQGRTGNSDGMGLEALGIQRDARGSIGINEFYQTAQPHIYAVGDVVGNPSTRQCGVRPGPLCRHACVDRHMRTSPGARHPHWHLHRAGNQLARRNRARADGAQGALRSGACVLPSSRPRANHRPHHRHAENTVSPRDAAHPRHSLLRQRGFRNYSYRLGHHVAAR